MCTVVLIQECKVTVVMRIGCVEGNTFFCVKTCAVEEK